MKNSNNSDRGILILTCACIFSALFIALVFLLNGLFDTVSGTVIYFVILLIIFGFFCYHAVDTND